MRMEMWHCTTFLTWAIPLTPCTKYHYAWSDDSSLKQAKAKIKPNEGKSENPYHVFDLEVDEKRQRVSSCGMQHDGSLGGLWHDCETTQEAKDKGWKLGCIFVIGCCGASVIDQEKCPRGTVLLTRQVKDYLNLNTGKVGEEGKVAGTEGCVSLWMYRWLIA